MQCGGTCSVPGFPTRLQFPRTVLRCRAKGLKEAYDPYVRSVLGLWTSRTACLRELTNHLGGLKTPEMDRYHLVEFPTNRWLDRDQLEASGGPSQCVLIAKSRQKIAVFNENQ